MENVKVFVKDNALNFTSNLSVNGQSYMPVGSILVYAGSIAPSGWLLCDGSTISRIDYSELFNIIGVTYGAGNGSTTFNLPNLQDRMPVGKGSINTAIGSTGGQDSVTLTTGQLPSHNHSASSADAGSHSHTATDSGHSHNFSDAYFAENRGLGTNAFGLGAASDNDNDYYNRSGTTATGNANISITSAGTHNHTITVDNTGSNNPIDIRNKFIVMNYIIRC